MQFHLYEIMRIDKAMMTGGRLPGEGRTGSGVEAKGHGVSFLG